MKLDILIVDDSIVYRKALFEAVEKTGISGDIKAISRGELALEWLKNKKADVILLDLYMPEMTGLEVLDAVKRDYPEIDVIMISSKDSDEKENVMKALSMGAFDFIFKPTSGDSQSNIIKIKNTLRILFYSIIQKRSLNLKSEYIHEANKEKKSFLENEGVVKSKNYFQNPFLILIACSTGGPSALENILSNKLLDVQSPILIVQHMPEDFTESLAKSLNSKSHMNVKEAEDMEVCEKGKVYIAKGGYHMEIKNKYGNPYIVLNKDSAVNGLRSSADKLFTSVANNFSGKKILAVVLTGMGNDGLLGVRELKEKCDCYCITQSEESCLVYGMPKSVENEKLSDESIDLESIAKRIFEINNKGLIC